LGALDLLSPLDGSSSSDTAARTRRLTSPAYVDTILIDTPA